MVAWIVSLVVLAATVTHSRGENVTVVTNASAASLRGATEAASSGATAEDQDATSVVVLTAQRSNATVGACQGQAGWERDFAHQMFSCGVQSFGRAAAAGRCMAKAQGVSDACGQCLGKLVSCGHGCMFQCCGGKCPGWGRCVRCNKRNCQTSFESCAGVTPSYWK